MKTICNFLFLIALLGAFATNSHAQAAGPIGASPIMEEGAGCTSLPFYTEFYSSVTGTIITIFIGRDGTLIIHNGDQIEIHDNYLDYIKDLNEILDKYLELQEACFYLMNGFEEDEDLITKEQCEENSGLIDDLIRLSEELLEALSPVC